MRFLHISSGGANTRLQQYMGTKHEDAPKSLLPIGQKGTLLDHILTNAINYFDKVRVGANEKNQNVLIDAVSVYDQGKVYVEVDKPRTGPLGQPIRHILHNQTRIYVAAGDSYAVFRWSDFDAFHESHGMPVSVVIYPSIAMPSVARLNPTSGKVTLWDITDTNDGDYINSSHYIIDPHPTVIDIAKKLKRHKEDDFFIALRDTGLLAAYAVDTIGFNVNTEKVYLALTKHV